ncbi:MAG: hypothetical protein Q9209_005747 [Squamulea sp. 1 TL-2023]
MLVWAHVLDRLERPVKATVDAKLAQSMRQLSQDVIREILQCCKDSKIDFVRLPLSDLNGLIALLGEQQNYADLEVWLQHIPIPAMTEADVLYSGSSRFFGNLVRPATNGKKGRSEAIRLCEDICYNMRWMWGSLDPKALEMSDLLSQLYTNMGHTREAQGVHENILRLVVEGDDGDDRTPDTMDSKTTQIYEDLIHDLKQMPEYKSQPEWKDVRPVNDWNVKEAPSQTEGKFEAPRTWYLVKPEYVNAKGEIKETPVKRPGMNVKRATSNWGLNFVHNLLHGNHENGMDRHKNTNGVSKSVDNRDDLEDGYESATQEVL